MLAGVEAGELQRAFDGFGAAVAEKSFRKIFSRRDVGDFLGEVSDRLHVIEIRRTVNELLHLRFCGGDDLRVAVACVDHGNSREAIEIFAAVDVCDRGTAGAIDYDRRDRLQEAGHDIIFVLLNGVCHWESFQAKGPVSVWCEEQLDYTFAGIGKSEVEPVKGRREAQVHDLWAKAMGMR